MSICYYFHPDGYVTAGRQVMGRHVAGESFLRGSTFWFQIRSLDPGREEKAYKHL